MVPSSYNPSDVEVHGISDADTKLSVGATVEPGFNGEEAATLTIEFASNIVGGFTFEDVKLDSDKCRGEAESADASIAPRKPLNLDVTMTTPVGSGKPVATTTLHGGQTYSSVSIVCDITSDAEARPSTSEITYSIPPVTVRAELKHPPDVSLNLSRGALDSIVASSRPPNITTLFGYTWKEELDNAEPVIVSVTNPDLRKAREQSVFLWGLLAGVAATFFVAAI